jgi:16S rRNA C967 or C1407 C5-methylase (RsmB/RsmF family)/NOL1/NOP2/fmu family ribosome biogenesis protein
MQLPEAFITRTKALLGTEWEAFQQSLNQERPISIRINPKKMTGQEPLFAVESPVSWASNAYYLPSRPIFTLDPLFHAGCYYVQEASSMSLEYFVKTYIRKPVKVLDLCAAPGGKSTHLSAVLPEGSLLVANEMIRSRANILSENLIKWGNPRTIVTNSDAQDMGKLSSFFDLIVCDLPCSGEGMFRKDSVAVSEWSVGNVKLCVERQRQIISAIFPALKPGGLLIYSTCTYNREENEGNLDWIGKQFEAELLEPPRRFMPHRTKGEGFFIAAFRKQTETPAITKSGFRRQSIAVPTTAAVSQWLSVPDDYVLFSENNTLLAFPSENYKDYLTLKQSQRIVSAGIALGENKGKDWIPKQALAMSVALSDKAFPRWDTDKVTALKYLRKEALQNIPAEIPLGLVLITYRNQPLGFIKNIGNRANNLYPPEWRIRMNVS